MKVDIINPQVNRFVFPIAHDMIVLASDRLPYVGYARPQAIRRAGRLVATTDHLFHDVMATYHPPGVDEEMRPQHCVHDNRTC